jgi:magnesium-transporting ATPase (P-type)
MPAESFRAWHSLSCDETLKRLTTSAEGLTTEEAQRRLATQGPNRLAHGHQRSALAVFAGQFVDLPMLVVVVLTFGLQLLVIYLPVCNDIFRTQPLPLPDLLVGILLAALVVPATEAEKWLIRRGYIYRSDTA